MGTRLIPLVTALGLLALCVVIHALMLSLLIRWYRKLVVRDSLRFFGGAWILVRVAWWTVIAHLLEIAIWAVAYVWIGAFPSFDVALYFSEVTYTTIGFGDVLIPPVWHLLAGIEGLTGILMAGWSTAFLFAVLNRLLQHGGHGPDRGRNPAE